MNSWDSYEVADCWGKVERALVFVKEGSLRLKLISFLEKNEVQARERLKDSWV